MAFETYLSNQGLQVSKDGNKSFIHSDESEYNREKSEAIEASNRYKQSQADLEDSNAAYSRATDAYNQKTAAFNQIHLNG